MAAPHPRRRALKGTSPTESASYPSSSANLTRCFPPVDPDMTLRKAATFHSPKSPSSEDLDPVIDVPSLPKRSQTCPKALEDAVAAGEKRMAGIIGSFDRSLSGLDSMSVDSQATLRAEDLPLPRVLLDAHIVDVDMMDVDPKPRRGQFGHRCQSQHVRKHHTSDSGIGSTVSGSIHSRADSGADVKQFTYEGQPRSRDTNSSASSRASLHLTIDTQCTRSAITRSISSTASSATANSNFLSDYAAKQIQKHIITPLLRQKVLKDFHPLVHGLPKRICQKEITCLRDLEKTLIFLAPVSGPLSLGEGVFTHCILQYLKKWSSSKTSYLNFCETSIQCIHTTVDHLNERDQRRPADRPYTNGYFLDLVEQVRQYAAMMAASRERQAAGEEAKEKDYSPDERLELQGGLSQNGRPAKLVRVKNGKTIAIGNHITGDDEDSSPAKHQVMKRSLSVGTSEDDSVTRSMARRRKSAQVAPKDLVQRCRDCDKEFKRPCDLTKHEKTHSRPWKCSESTCKYSSYGWPTEKERDRHVNDKHSTAPPLYRCNFHPCPYQSKRESNCKQHMEKAHGWTYLRSKNNGSKNKRGQTGQIPSAPQVATPYSSIMDPTTPLSGEAPSPYDQYENYSRRYSVDGSTSASDQITPYSNGSVFNDRLNGFYNHAGTNFDFNEFPETLQTPDQIEYSPGTNGFHRPSFDAASLTNAPTVPSSFDTSLTSPDLDRTLGNFDWTHTDNDFTSYNVQMATPASSVVNRPSLSFSHDPSLPINLPTHAPIPSLSPGAQGNLMLYTPHSTYAADEGYDEFMAEAGKPTTDFPLFDGSHGASSLSSAANENMFPELPTFGSQFAPSGWSGRGTDLAQQFGINDFMQLDEEYE